MTGRHRFGGQPWTLRSKHECHPVVGAKTNVGQGNGVSRRSEGQDLKPCVLDRGKSIGERLESGVWRTKGLAHGHPAASAVQRITAARIEQVGLNAERNRAPENDPEVCRIVDALDDGDGVRPGNRGLKVEELPSSETGQNPSVEVVAGYPLQNLRSAGVQRHLIIDHIRKRFCALPVYQQRLKPVSGSKCPLDHDVAFGHKEPGHVAVRLLALAPKHVVPKALENCDPVIVRIVYLDSQTGRSAPVASNVGANVVGEQLQHFTGTCVASGFAFAVDLGAVNDDVKDALSAGHQPEILDDMLVVAKKVLSHAHGVG